MLLLCLGPLTPRAMAVGADSRAGAVSISSGYLNVRSKASAASTVVARLNKGSYVTLLSKSGSWWKVEYGDGKTGYCHADYITTVQGSPVTVQISSGWLNVRSGAGSGYARVGKLTKGETVLLLKTAGDWSRVLYDGVKTGWVSSAYLSGAYSAVSLKVPSYKQMDARWADAPIGTEGDTMAQSGCATTGIAMLESYRLGKSIYPDAMALELRYTPSGKVYWPSHFKTVTDNEGWLARVYSLLGQGKPVLLGARNAYGSQHWVVITGFTGGSSLTADRFTIQDPGTNYRTSLQQFLQEFPYFYKYFHY